MYASCVKLTYYINVTIKTDWLLLYLTEEYFLFHLFPFNNLMSIFLNAVFILHLNLKRICGMFYLKHQFGIIFGETETE